MAQIQHNVLTGSNDHEPLGVSGASSGTVYIADGAGSGSWAKNAAANVTVADSGGYFTGSTVEAVLQELGPSIAGVTTYYGEIYTHANATATTLSVAATNYHVAQIATDGLSSGTTLGTGYIEVTTAGVYEIEASVSFTGTTNNTYELSVGVDVGSGYAQVAKSAIQRKASSTDVGACSVHCLQSFSVGDKIGLMAQNVAATNDITVTYANLSAHRLGA